MTLVPSQAERGRDSSYAVHFVPTYRKAEKYDLDSVCVAVKKNDVIEGAEWMREGESRKDCRVVHSKERVRGVWS